LENLKLLEGGFEEDENAMEKEMLFKMGLDKKITKSEFEYLKAASMQSLSSRSAKKFFGDPKLIHRFGISTALKVRIGLCDYSGVSLIYFP